MKFLLFLTALISPFFLSSQCIDETLINTDVMCPGIYAPVCGCDGVTYSNSCVAQNHNGVTEWTDGECPTLTLCVDLGEIDFGLCDMWLGYAVYDGQCTGLSGCGYTVDEIDYSPYFFEDESSCIEYCGNPEPCLDMEGLDFGLCAMWLGWTNYGGQCVSLSGCGYIIDGTDYSPYFYEEETDCIAACGEINFCQDVEGIDFGLCNMWLGYAMLGGQCQSISGCGYLVNEVDYSSAFYPTLSECHQACGEPQDCVNPIQQEWGFVIDCAGEGEPVCGCDNVTYTNSCHAFYYGGVVTYAQGPCLKNQEQCQAIPSMVDFGACAMPLGFAFTENGCVMTSGCSYVGNNGYDYSSYFFESEYQCVASCIIPIEVDCVDEEQIDFEHGCPEVLNPVCGCDSITYINDCYAHYYGGVANWTQGACQTASINSTDNGKLSVFPNPTQSQLNISFTSDFDVSQINVYDLTGKIIMSFRKNYGELTSINTSSLSSGIYILECKNEHGAALRKQFIKE